MSQQKLMNIRSAITNKIVGQKDLIENLIVCLLANGHMLIEGMPGLAKTTAAKAIAESVEGNFHRIQFTPDLLPSDIIGTEIYVHDTGKFNFREGPIFNNIVLADEINRAPAKVQSALLEAMGEGQVTVGHKSYKLPELYIVLATQNPIEQEGTYNLPEAQLDRFLMYMVIDYPSYEEELQIIALDEKKQNNKEAKGGGIASTSQKELFAARSEVAQVHISDSLKSYIATLVTATRNPANYDAQLAKWIMYGASPRATLALIRCAKALCWLRGDEYVTPDHIQTLCPFILTHRIIPSFEAETNNISRRTIINRLLEVVAIP
ncbi:MAG: MoxR family ATPase [Rickettsiales bacterium]|nr:MoxR family ATPase [Rickettsiales bacterium]MCA0254578.1 MoxR family ATPase [Pseudomonadota bacterium]